jgi:hypothetical protein
MFKLVGMAAVVTRISKTFDEYERESYNIFAHYAAEAMKWFIQVQGSASAETKGMFWTNHTFEAVRGFFAKAWQVPGARMGITFANDTWYAKNLEEDYGGRFASFPAMVDRFLPMIEADLKRLYGDTT